MKIKRKPEATPSRRSFLRGTGVLAALPFMETLSPHALRAGAKVPAKPPLRFGIFTVTGGTVYESWVPKETGTLGKLPSILRPLEANKDQILILSNLAQSGNSTGLNAHQHCAYLHLSAVDHVGKTETGKPVAGQSVDSRAAELLGPQSLIPAMRMGSSGGETTYFFDQDGRNLPVERDPFLAFERMFKGRTLLAPNWGRRLSSGQPGDKPVQAKTHGQQVVDLLLEDAKGLRPKVSKYDQAKLDEYLESVYSIERRINRVQQWIAMEALDLGDPGPSVPRAPDNLPKNRAESDKLIWHVDRNPSLQGEFIQIMSDLMVLAFQTDTTRVCSLGLGSDGALFPGVVTVGREFHAHTLEHHGNARTIEEADPVAREGCRQIHSWYTSYFAKAVQKMLDIDEGGSSLLDNSLLLYTSYMSDGGHGRKNYPVLLAGNAGGTLKTGRHLQYQENTPMANLYVEILGRLGDDSGEFGNSRTSPKAAYDGRLPGLAG